MTRIAPKREQRWILFSRGCLHGIRRSDLTVICSVPSRSITRSTVSVFSVSRSSALLASAAILALVIYCFAGCAGPVAQRGGSATTAIRQVGHANSATLAQPENPQKPSRQTVESDQTIEYVLPAGTMLLEQTGVGAGAAAPEKFHARRPAARIPARPQGNSSAFTNIPVFPSSALLDRPMTVRVMAKDRTETVLGAAQRDTAREWTARASGLKPVMIAGIFLLTVVAGALMYFGWWTKAAVAAGVGLGMIVLAQTLPGKETLILFGGLGVFALAALLVLYAYHKGILDRNQNGIPDILERDRQTQA